MHTTVRAHTKVFPTYLKHLKDTKFSWLCHILSEIENSGFILKNKKCEHAEKTCKFLNSIGLNTNEIYVYAVVKIGRKDFLVYI